MSTMHASNIQCVKAAPLNDFGIKLPETWFYDHAELKRELRSIRAAYPRLGVTGFMEDCQGDAPQNHRDPLMTSRFVGQFARALTYLTEYTVPATPAHPGVPIELHRQLAKQLGAPVSVGALICAQLALGDIGRELAEAVHGRAVRLNGRLPLPISAVHRTPT